MRYPGSLILTIAFVFVRTLFLHYIFGDVDEDRTGTAGSSDVEGFVDGWSDVFDAGDQVVVLGDGKRRAGDVGFLESVGTDRGASDLSGNGDDGHGIHHRGG